MPQEHTRSAPQGASLPSHDQCVLCGYSCCVIPGHPGVRDCRPGPDESKARLSIAEKHAREAATDAKQMMEEVRSNDEQIAFLRDENSKLREALRDIGVSALAESYGSLAESYGSIEQWVAHGREWVEAGWDPRDAKGEPALFMAARVSADGRASLAVVRRWGNWWIYADRSDVNGCYSEVVPYLADPGTCGHALGQVRRAWGDQHITPRLRRVALDGKGKWVTSTKTGPCTCGGGHWYGDTEHESLLAARRAAP